MADTVAASFPRAGAWGFLQSGEPTPPGSPERERRECGLKTGYLRCGILCFGFARARCTGCGHGFLVAFSCKGTARPVTPADLAHVTERIRTRLVRWFRRKRFLDAEAATAMRAWAHSGFSIDASVRVTLVGRDVPSYFWSLEHLLRYCARPAFALERLSLLSGHDGSPERIRYTLPRHKRSQWIGPGRRRQATGPGQHGVIDLEPFEFPDRLAVSVRPSDVGRCHRVCSDPTPEQRPPVTIVSLAEVPLTVLSFGAISRLLRYAGHGKHAQDLLVPL